jgi:serine phosphatase RsbU (regulator of sigma subunit)
MVSVMAIGTLLLISNDSMNISLSKINRAAQDMASGKDGHYFPRVSDRELVTFSRNFNKAAVEINELRNDLERRVTERTEELEAAYARLSDAYEQIHDDLLLARSIQHSILHKDPEGIRGIKLRTLYYPMSEVGGDFYDITELRRGYVRIFLADAMGHGVRAAMVTMIIKSEYDKVKYMEDPADLLTRLNNSFISLYTPLNQYFTCFVADIDIEGNVIKYSSAGHSDQFHIHDGRLEILQHRGKIIGIVRDAPYTTVTGSFSSRDRLLLFTDGIFEEFNDINEAFGMQRLRQVVEEVKTSCIDEIHAAIIERLKGFLKQGDDIARNDDIVLIGLEFDDGGRPGLISS